jgi:hypothetical protein
VRTRTRTHVRTYAKNQRQQSLSYRCDSTCVSISADSKPKTLEYVAMVATSKIVYPLFSTIFFILLDLYRFCARKLLASYPKPKVRFSA